MLEMLGTEEDGIGQAFGAERWGGQVLLLLVLTHSRHFASGSTCSCFLKLGNGLDGKEGYNRRDQLSLVMIWPALPSIFTLIKVN